MYWGEMRGVPARSFILSEYLPGRDLGCQSLWKEGTLVLIKTYERLSYLGTGSQPSQVSSVAALAKTVFEPRVVDICKKAVRALDPRASGVFSVDLRESAGGVPCITEINAGRFSSATNIFDLTGKYNMAATYVRLALGGPVDLRDEYDVARDYYMLRDVDTPPGVFHAEQFFEGIEDARR
jgi:carbamoyl-phosphate synthase large subunit